MPLVMKTLTIPAGESLSNAIDVTAQNTGIRRIVMPPAWTDAWLTLKASNDGVTYYDVYWEDGQPFVVNVVPNTLILVHNENVLRRGFFKLQSGQSDDPTPQEEARVFICGIE